MHDTSSTSSVHESKKLIEQAKGKKLLAEKEANTLMAQLSDEAGGENIRTRLLNTIKTAEEASTEYTRKMEQAVREGIITHDDLEQGLEFFKQSDAQTKKNVFVASTDERLNFAKKQILNYYEFFSKNANLWSKDEEREKVKGFLKMNAEERNEEMEEIKEKKKERKKIHESMEKLMEHELIDDISGRKKIFFTLDIGEKREYLKKLENKLKRREKVQSKLRKETDASKELCGREEWQEALPHCKKAMEIIQKNNVLHVEWFKERNDIIVGIIEKIQMRGAEGDTELEILKKIQQEKSIEPTENESEKTTEEEQEELSEKEKNELTELLIHSFMQSKKASLASVNAFVHATDATKMIEHQQEVEEKDNILAEDHEEEEDSVLCIEGDINRMMQEKGDAIAYDEDLNKKNFAIIDSNESILSADASDARVNKNIEEVLKDLIETLPINAQQRNYLHGSIQNIQKNNFGNTIRSEGAEGLDEHEATLGKNFNANKRDFAALVTETILSGNDHASETEKTFMKKRDAA